VFGFKLFLTYVCKEVVYRVRMLGLFLTYYACEEALLGGQLFLTYRACEVSCSSQVMHARSVVPHI